VIQHPTIDNCDFQQHHCENIISHDTSCCLAESSTLKLGEVCLAEAFGTYLPNLCMESSVISVLFKWQYECELFDFQEDTVLSLDCSTLLYMLSCTLTTCWLLWDQSTRSTSGGRNTSLLSRWLVDSQLIKSYLYLKLRSLNIPHFCHDICLALQ
jgi:hypothetical protein